MGGKQRKIEKTKAEKGGGGVLRTNMPCLSVCMRVCVGWWCAMEMMALRQAEGRSKEVREGGWHMEQHLRRRAATTTPPPTLIKCASASDDDLYVCDGMVRLG